MKNNLLDLKHHHKRKRRKLSSLLHQPHLLHLQREVLLPLPAQGLVATDQVKQVPGHVQEHRHLLLLQLLLLQLLEALLPLHQAVLVGLQDHPLQALGATLGLEAQVQRLLRPGPKPLCQAEDHLYPHQGLVALEVHPEVHLLVAEVVRLRRLLPQRRAVQPE